MKRNNVKNKIPHFKISQIFGQDPPAIFCPACGVPVIGKGKARICPHVLFSYLDAVGEFSTIAPAYEKEIRAIKPADGIHDPIKAALKLFEGRESVFCITINFGGMACGPVNYSLTAAFDYSPEKIKRAKRKK